MLRAPSLIVIALLVAPPALAQDHSSSYGLVDETNARITVERVTTQTAIDYNFNIVPKSGLRVGGAAGIKVSLVSADGWTFLPRLPRQIYAGNDYFDGAPEVTISAQRAAGAGPATLLLQYSLCRDQACVLRNVTVKITQD